MSYGQSTGPTPIGVGTAANVPQSPSLLRDIEVIHKRLLDSIKVVEIINQKLFGDGGPPPSDIPSPKQVSLANVTNIVELILQDIAALASHLDRTVSRL